MMVAHKAVSPLRQYIQQTSLHTNLKCKATSCKLRDAPWIQTTKQEQDWKSKLVAAKSSGNVKNSTRAGSLGFSPVFCCCRNLKKSETQLTASVLKKNIQNTQEIERTIFNCTKQDKTCKFSRKASFSSYVQQYNRKQLNQLILYLILYLQD